MNTIKNKTQKINWAFGSLAIVLGLAACSPSDIQSTEALPGPEDFSVDLVMDEVPGNVMSVAESRQQLSPGDPVVVRGQIGGVLEPFMSGYAGFVLGDTDILFCDEMSDAEHCPTPWDACCEDKEQLQGRRLSVQFVDAQGNPLEGDLKQALNLKELDTVVVSGTVSEASTPENMLINAKAMAMLD